MRVEFVLKVTAIFSDFGRAHEDTKINVIFGGRFEGRIRVEMLVTAA